MILIDLLEKLARVLAATDPVLTKFAEKAKKLGGDPREAVIKVFKQSSGFDPSEEEIESVLELMGVKKQIGEGDLAAEVTELIDKAIKDAGFVNNIDPTGCFRLSVDQQNEDDVEVSGMIGLDPIAWTDARLVQTTIRRRVEDRFLPFFRKRPAIMDLIVDFHHSVRQKGDAAVVFSLLLHTELLAEGGALQQYFVDEIPNLIDDLKDIVDTHKQHTAKL